jgi:vacuolar protein sorting-associated protein 26
MNLKLLPSLKLWMVHPLEVFYSDFSTKKIGETIPIRLFLSGFELTPTYRDVNKKFSTRYYLNLVLVDEENRRYFKQQEITIYRIQDDSEEYKDIAGNASVAGLSKFTGTLG